MHKPTTFSDEAVSKWAEDQVRDAERVPEGRHRGDAKLIIEHAYAIRQKLVTSPPATYELRRSQLIAERLTDRRDRRPPNERELKEWNAEAAELAYREARPEVMQRVDQIVALWGEIEGR